MQRETSGSSVAKGTTQLGQMDSSTTCGSTARAGDVDEGVEHWEPNWDVRDPGEACSRQRSRRASRSSWLDRCSRKLLALRWQLCVVVRDFRILQRLVEVRALVSKISNQRAAQTSGGFFLWIRRKGERRITIITRPYHNFAPFAPNRRKERAHLGVAGSRNQEHGPPLRLPAHLAHPLKDDRAVLIHAVGASLQGSRQNRGEPRRLFASDIPGRGFVVVMTGRFCSINAGAPFDDIEVYLQNALFAEDELGHRYK